MRAVGLISSSRRSSASLNVMPPRMALLRTHRSATSLSLPANLASSSMASSMQTVESTSKQTQSAALHMARVWLSVRFSVRDPGMLALLLVLVPL
ncbi:unnamed protein product [Ixodes persulcatus]